MQGKSSYKLPLIYIVTVVAVGFTLKALEHHFILVVYQILNKDKQCS